jgi:hypothetical protein
VRREGPLHARGHQRARARRGARGGRRRGEEEDGQGEHQHG